MSGEGDKAVFRLAEGATTVETADAVVAFCSAHVGENDLEQCTAALSQVRRAAAASGPRAAAATGCPTLALACVRDRSPSSPFFVGLWLSLSLPAVLRHACGCDVR